MFWTVSTAAGAGYLCEVNLTTGEATKLMDFPGNAEVTGLIIKTPTFIGDAPAAPQNLLASFPGGALSGKLTFTVPAILYNGLPASGSVEYTVKANDKVVATGSTAYGRDVTVPLAFTEAGMVEFTVVLSNDAGEGPASAVSSYIGPGAPDAPAGVHASWDAGKMTVSWEAVTTSSDGGYLNPSDVRYTVTDAAGTEIARNTASTKIELNIPEPERLTRYTYSVTASCNGLYSPTVATNTVCLGLVYAPYDADIFSQEDFDSFTVIDANKDGRTWQYGDKTARVMMHNQHDTDDWLITVPIYLEAGHVYHISTSVFGSAYSTERFELKVGREPTAEAMTETIVEPTELSRVGDYKIFGADYKPALSGKYYIGLHGISTRFNFALNTHGIYVSEGQLADKPDAGTLVAVPSPAGDYEITLRMTAPDRDLVGVSISSLSKSELYRDDKLIQTWNSPAPGSSWEYKDVVGHSGDVKYTFVSYNDAGQGRQAEATVFCGTPRPAQVTGICAVENAAAGEITLRWNPVTVDVNGMPLNPDKVKYSAYVINEKGEITKVIAENLQATSVTYRETGLDAEQRFMQWAVNAVTEGGENTAASELFPIGKPYVGLEDSFTDGVAHYLYGIDQKGTGAAWILADDRTFIDQNPYDGDNGHLYFMAGYTDDEAAFFTGKITLEGMLNPCLKFYTNAYTSNNLNLLSAKVREAGTNEWTTVYSKRMNEISDGIDWVQVLIPLSDFEGKVIQVAIDLVATSHQYGFIDKMAVEPLVDHDLRVNTVNGPKKAKAGYEFPLRVTVENKGSLTADAYNVEIYADSECVGSGAGEAGLLPEGKTTVIVPVVMNRFVSDGVSYTAKVFYDKDMVPSNDMGPATFVPCVAPSYPGVSNLQGVYGPQANNLSWMEPSLDSPDRPTLETFEQADAWDQEYEDWIFVDRDASPTSGFNDFSIPGIHPGHDVSSFFIFDSSDASFNETFDAVSGTKFLAAMYRFDNGPTDDWAISPELTGKDQTVSFFAKSYRDIYPERIEVYYSTGSVDPDDFILLEDGVIEKVPGYWTCYEFSLPEGADRFAIRSCATGGLLLMLDDFDFMAASVTKDLELRGYDVWRDRVKMNAEPMREVAWDDAARVASATHTYTVIPVYNRGEGKSARVSIGDPQSVDAINADGITVSRSGKFIKVTGAEGQPVTLTDATGKVLWRGLGTTTTLIPAPSGLMIVKAGAKVAKIMIP